MRFIVQSQTIERVCAFLFPNPEMHFLKDSSIFSSWRVDVSEPFLSVEDKHCCSFCSRTHRWHQNIFFAPWSILWIYLLYVCVHLWHWVRIVFNWLVMFFNAEFMPFDMMLMVLFLSSSGKQVAINSAFLLTLFLPLFCHFIYSLHTHHI